MLTKRSIETFAYTQNSVVKDVFGKLKQSKSGAANKAMRRAAEATIANFVEGASGNIKDFAKGYAIGDLMLAIYSGTDKPGAVERVASVLFSPVASALIKLSTGFSISDYPDRTSAIKGYILGCLYHFAG